MGQDKALLPFGGSHTLAHYQYDRLTPLFSRVYLSAKTRDKFDFDPNVIEDPADVDFAPTAGFVSAFRALPDNHIMVMSVDTPFIDETIFQPLLDALAPDIDAVIAKTPSGTHPMCGIYSRSLQPELERMLQEGDHRLGKLLSTSRTLYVPFDDESLFANLNHPHEYEAAISCYNNKKVKDTL